MSFLARRVIASKEDVNNLSFISTNESSYAMMPSFDSFSWVAGDYLEFQFRLDEVALPSGNDVALFGRAFSSSNVVSIKSDEDKIQISWDGGSSSGYLSAPNIWDGNWHKLRLALNSGLNGVDVLYDDSFVAGGSGNYLTALSRLRYSPFSSHQERFISFRNYVIFEGGVFKHNLPISDGSGSIIKDNGASPLNGNISGVEGVDFEWA